MYRPFPNIHVRRMYGLLLYIPVIAALIISVRRMPLIIVMKLLLFRDAVINSLRHTMNISNNNTGKAMLRQLVLFFSLLSLGSSSVAATLKFESPVERVAVIELFTSHGCSSCPPADKWLRRFENHPGLWKEVVPLAFHVDYWDYLGWSDRFAKSEYSKRQRSYRESGALRSVYTPGFVLNGREWRGWFRRSEPNLEPGAEVGRLVVEADAGKGVRAKFYPTDNWKGGKLRAHLALLGFGLSSKIGGGENSGRTLQEDFVVLADSSANANDDLTWELPWPSTKSGEQPSALVVWLTREGNPAPVQITGGWFPESEK